MGGDLNALYPLIYDTIETPDRWFDVLAAICEATGASKAVLALRDRLTAELILPTHLKNTLSSPMLYGIDEAFVESYIGHFVQYDPWTPIEKLVHPTVPYALSDYLPHAELEAGPFWEWLQPQGIGDTVVASIGESPKQWVAMNVYFPHDRPEIREHVLDVMNALLPRLRGAWSVGEIVRERGLEEDRARRFLESYREAAMLIRPDGSLVAANESARRLATCPIRPTGGGLKFESGEVREAFKAQAERLGERDKQQQSVRFELEGYEFILCLMGPAEDSLGMDRATRLLTAVRLDDDAEFLRRPVWEMPALNLRERELVHHLAVGGTLRNFTDRSGLSVHGTDSRWRSVKKKLKLEHPREIFAIHRLFMSQNHDWS